MDLRKHIESTGTISDIAAFLSNLPLHERAGTMLSLPKRHQRTLYLKAEASEPVVAVDLVPEAMGDEVGVCHHGFNSLPFFRDFEKHFARRGDQIFGFNEGSLRRFIGPGYFVCRPTTLDERARSGWVVDYFDVPERGLSDWPEVRSNGRGLQALVYHHTRDYLRKVCDGVLIGSAYKTLLGREFKLDSYFVLVRAPC